jgi:bifunctional non-homologous end joining protein LigD
VELTTKDIERPNRLVWDFDPGPRTKWADVVARAKTIREMLETLGLESWVKTTGGRGIHVVAPIAPHRQWRGMPGVQPRRGSGLGRHQSQRSTRSPLRRAAGSRRS